MTRRQRANLQTQPTWKMSSLHKRKQKGVMRILEPTQSQFPSGQVAGLDSFDPVADNVSGTEDHLAEDMDNMSKDRGEEETSDEEEVAEPIQPLRRLRGKQPAPQYGAPPQPAADNPDPAPPAVAPSSRAVPVIKRPAMLKRPSGRAPKPSQRCRGFDGVACQFCPNEPGKPARVQAHQGHRHCIFCNKEKMQESRGRGRRCVVTPALKKFLLANEQVFEAALQR